MPQVFPLTRQQTGGYIQPFFPTAPLLINLEWLHLGDATWWLGVFSDLTGVDKTDLLNKLLWCLDRIFLNADQNEETLQEMVPDLASLLTEIENAAAQNTAWSGYDVWSAPVEERG